jgi:hypothetical protein
MKKLLPSVLLILFSCNDSPKRNKAYVPDSNGRINAVSVVMPEKDWNGALGETVRQEIGAVYEGLPIDEPQFTFQYLNPKVFTDFARHSRNILWFQKDSMPSFSLAQNQFARPQIVVKVVGDDAATQAFYIKENATLIQQTFQENEYKEKLRRIRKDRTTEQNLSTNFGIQLEYPSAYKTFKTAENFIWIQKPIQKGHLNLAVYTLPLSAMKGKVNERILAIRDSIGKKHLPGRLPNTYMSNETDYLPYFYKTKLQNKTTYLTKGMWNVYGDYMAGPFVNYMLLDQANKRWVVLEGFAFAPSISKREYMFELNTIIRSVLFNEAKR